jgi:dihydrofolate synthase/folylpolyglutamate synthase
MELDYNAAIEYLFGLQRMGIKLGLENIRRVLEAIGNPHEGLVVVHVGGSNGKGSTAAHLEAILLKAGVKVGLYTSPHLVRFTERIRVNRQEILEEEVVRWTRKILEACPHLLAQGGRESQVPITFFEFTTAMAFGYFVEKGVDVAIMEVGMGGRLDATNVCHPVVSVITSVSLEHQDYLGKTLVEIAREKAGIVKHGVPVISGVIHPVAQGVIRDACVQRGAPLYRLGREITAKGSPWDFNYQGIKRGFKKLKTSLRGKHQVRNAAMAIAAAEVLAARGFSLEERAVREGLEDVHWPGRQQYIQGPPAILLDGAHNPEAMRSLCSSLRKDYRYSRLRVLMGVMRDKDYLRMLKMIVPMAHELVFCKPNMERAEDPWVLQDKALALGARATVSETVEKGLEDLFLRASREDLICATGSLFVVGEALAYLEKKSLI